MKRLQRASFGLVPEAKREKAWAKHRRQNAWALKYGYRIISFVVQLFLAMVALTATYMFAIQLYEAGVFNPPGTE